MFQVLNAPRTIAVTEEIENVKENPTEIVTNSFEFDYERIKVSNGEENLQLLLEDKDIQPVVYGAMTKKAKQFLTKTVKPVTGCLIHHFGGAKDRFLLAYGESYSNFSTKCKGLSNRTCSKSTPE